jgi:cytochrome P450
MILNPEAQAKAQAEIDRVLETGRLPEFSDQESLPYLTAIMKEVVRYVYRPILLPFNFSLVTHRRFL